MHQDMARLEQLLNGHLDIIQKEESDGSCGFLLDTGYSVLATEKQLVQLLLVLQEKAHDQNREYVEDHWLIY